MSTARAKSKQDKARQRVNLTQADIRELGSAHNPTGQGWASPGTDYGAKIAAIARRIVGTRAE